MQVQLGQWLQNMTFALVVHFLSFMPYNIHLMLVSSLLYSAYTCIAMSALIFFVGISPVVSAKDCELS